MNENARIKADAEAIDKLGGTCAVARLCRVKSPSVSEWKRNGIPDARRQLLEHLFPKVFPADKTKAAA